MPLRKRDKQPSKQVTLSEALNWVAFDNFDGPELTDNELQIGMFGECDNVEAIEIAQWQRNQDREAGEYDLFAALRDGEIEATGFKGTITNASKPWHTRNYSYHDDTRQKIPPDFWRREGVKWVSNVAKGTSCEYIEIILERESVLSIWKLDHHEGATDGASPVGTKTSARGRRATYRETDFFALCAWEANLNGLPETQAQFIRRMSELLAVVWGEDQTPGETWLKEKVRAIYEQKDTYERGRQMCLEAS